jgi:hypothetical protein
VPLKSGKAKARKVVAEMQNNFFVFMISPLRESEFYWIEPMRNE